MIDDDEYSTQENGRAANVPWMDGIAGLGNPRR